MNVAVHRYGRGLTVTAVSGNTIPARGRNGQTVTVQVSATTTYSRAGATASLADITAGSVIAVQGSRTGSTINATSITIVLPHVDGRVTAVNGTSYTVTDRSATYTAATTGSTIYVNAGGTSAAASTVKVGVSIVEFAGQADDTGVQDAVTALRTHIKPLLRHTGLTAGLTGDTVMPIRYGYLPLYPRDALPCKKPATRHAFRAMIMATVVAR
jgi:hypothetical protein